MRKRGVAGICACREGSRKAQSVSCGEEEGSDRTSGIGRSVPTQEGRG